MVLAILADLALVPGATKHLGAAQVAIEVSVGSSAVISGQTARQRVAPSGKGSHFHAEIIPVDLGGDADLSQVVHALDFPCALPTLREGGQQHAGQDGDYGYNH